MLVMPANATGWFWHCLARETGRIGHLYSPGSQRGPWPWFPFALDNGAFACWDMKRNVFDSAKWGITYEAWRDLLYWAASSVQRPRWDEMGVPLGQFTLMKRALKQRRGVAGGVGVKSMLQRIFHGTTNPPLYSATAP